MNGIEILGAGHQNLHVSRDVNESDFFTLEFWLAVSLQKFIRYSQAYLFKKFV